MKILVCIKQVPDAADIKIDPASNTLRRGAVSGVVNPHDLLAVETALRLKEANRGSSITLLSMGPAQAGEALRECLALGCEQAFLASDRAFGGSDTLATSRVLAEAVRHIEAVHGRFALILCGKRSADGETAQVGPELAERLDIPQITGAVELEILSGAIRAKRETSEGWDVLEAALPCLITIGDTEYGVRYPTIKSIRAADRVDIPVLGAAVLGIAPATVGLTGSPTKVAKAFAASAKSGGIVIAESTPEASVNSLLNLLAEAKVIWGKTAGRN